MLDSCPTIKIKAANPSGHVLINESDFDPTKHERFIDAPPPLPPPPAPIQRRETLKLKAK